MPEYSESHSAVEKIKLESRYLRGDIAAGLADVATGALSSDDIQLTKFHGFYQQDNRDFRAERKKQKLEPWYQFMLRMRLPGGCLTPKQWLELDQASRAFGNGTMRITTRQTFQFHGVIKKKLKAMMQAINRAALDTRGGCGDVNRNVIACANPYRSSIHWQVHELAQAISAHLLWKSRAYDELWLDALPTDRPDSEPLYGKTYLPRKFKVALAIPPENDCDVFANDIALIAIVERGELTGFNVAVGGGMGASYGVPTHYPRLASMIGFCRAEHVLPLVEQVVGIQRDYGNRTDRSRSRFKYTLDDRGLDWFNGELSERLGFALESPRPCTFTQNGDRFGWVEGEDGLSHLTLFIESGRIADMEGYALMSAMREMAKTLDRLGCGEIRLTCNQNLILARIPREDKDEVSNLAERLKLMNGLQQSALRQSSIACVAFPTCGLAMAEAERYLPSLITKLEVIMEEAGLEASAINIRMSGCPNGCARPYLGEIAFTGKAPGKYNLYLGGTRSGERLNKLYRENINEEEILRVLSPLIRSYAEKRSEGECFGDFVVRAGAVKPTLQGRDFHAEVHLPT